VTCRRFLPHCSRSIASDGNFTTLRKLASRLADRAQLKRRIEAMQKDRGAFQEAVESLAERVGDPVDVGPLALGERLRKRLQHSEKSEADDEAASKKIANAEADVRKSEDDLAAIDARVKERAAVFAGIQEVHSVDDLLDVLAKAETSADLSEKSKELADRIVTRLGVSSLAEAEEMLFEQDAVGLEGQRAATVADLGAAEAEYEAKIGDMRAAHDALERVGGDSAPARLEEKRQTLLLDLEERAKAALKLRLGILAAEQALAAYRDEHRSKMLADTEAAFKKLTAGRYQDLRTQADGQNEILLALRQQDNRSITVDEMSKGTRFQLYLALRLAGYRQYASNGVTLPFVADDIMETFDNKRTAAALGLLNEIASQGQALYFTHHEHVVEMARKVCGEGLTIHEITG
jgi:uncharacterized protein YhaN